MKTFNLHLILIPLFSMFSTISAQENIPEKNSESDSRFLEDSQFHNSLKDKYELNYEKERREINYSNALHDADFIHRHFPELGLSITLDSKGNLVNIGITEEKENVDYAELGLVAQLQSEYNEFKGRYHLINYGGIYQRIQDHIATVSKHREDDLHNEGYAWNGGRKVVQNQAGVNKTNTAIKSNRSNSTYSYSSPTRSNPSARNIGTKYSGRNAKNPHITKSLGAGKSSYGKLK